MFCAGYEALEACDADASIRILEARDDIDLVFTDVQMPGTMDGLKLAHYIRNRRPPVRLMVASGQAILAESSLPVGGRFFANPTTTMRSRTPWQACWPQRPDCCG